MNDRPEPKKRHQLNEAVLCAILVLLLAGSLLLAWYVSGSTTHTLRIP